MAYRRVKKKSLFKINLNHMISSRVSFVLDVYGSMVSRPEVCFFSKRCSFSPEQKCVFLWSLKLIECLDAEDERPEVQFGMKDFSDSQACLVSATPNSRLCQSKTKVCCHRKQEVKTKSACWYL